MSELLPISNPDLVKLAQAFTHQFSGITSRIITPCSVGLPSVPESVIEARALWDTGASESGITLDLAKRLNLISVGTTKVIGISGSDEASLYRASISFNDCIKSDDHKFMGLDVIDDYDVIVGMDFISYGDFALTASLAKGSLFSFRCPSIVRIDFEEHSRQILCDEEDS